MIALLAIALSAPAGCRSASATVVEARPELGTVVEISAWGDDRTAVREAVEKAFGRIEGVERQLDSYDPDSEISFVNADPYTPAELPEAAKAILDRIAELGVDEQFDVRLGGVMALWSFGESETLPAPDDLEQALSARLTREYPGGSVAFVAPPQAPLEPIAGRAATSPAWDFGGAAKGYALDQAAEVLAGDPAVAAALVSAGSTTIAIGEKPDGSPWRVGIEDPRDLGRIVATMQRDTGPLAVSTSGDYQQSFESGGTLYHHILDPATGMPARGLRSLTVSGSALSALDTDILSTALFVMGAEDAMAYAMQRDLSVYAVTSDGQVLSASPGDRGVLIEQVESPRKE